MANIGNRRDAQRAYDFAHGILVLPAGWEFLGDGGCRIVLLHRSANVVYKVDMADGYTNYDNDQELRNARQLARRAHRNDGWYNDYVRIPKTSGYNLSDGSLVIAMQYINAPTAYKSDRISRIAAVALLALGFQDMHPHNFLVDEDGTLWPIDMGSPRSQRAADRSGAYYSGADTRCLRGTS